MKTEYDFRLMDQKIECTLVAHDEALKRAIENNRCVRCGCAYRVEINLRNITFRCVQGATCGWSAIYPIRTIGNSERARQDENLDMVAIAEREVIDAAIALVGGNGQADAQTFTEHLDISTARAGQRLCEAVTLLESRKQIRNNLKEGD